MQQITQALAFVNQRAPTGNNDVYANATSLFLLSKVYANSVMSKISLRLGNLSSSRLKLVSPLLSLNKHLVVFHNNCSVCPLAKQTRQPFPNNSITTKFPFELLHCDVWGPHKVPTHTGARFFLTIVDDFTRCTWIFLMQSKLETTPLLTKFINFARTQFDTLVKIVRTNNGTEFHPLENFLHHHALNYKTHVSTLLNRTM